MTSHHFRELRVDPVVAAGHHCWPTKCVARVSWASFLFEDAMTRFGEQLASLQD